MRSAHGFIIEVAPGLRTKPHLRTSAGSVLLEVVLALFLFVGAATVISSGLSASLKEVDRLRLSIHGRNLAATVFAEMQMGLKPVESSGPNAFDPPFDMWTWQADAGPVPDAIGGINTLQKVEVITRHKSQPVVFRLTQFLPAVIQVHAPAAASLRSFDNPPGSGTGILSPP